MKNDNNSHNFYLKSFMKNDNYVRIYLYIDLFYSYVRMDGEFFFLNFRNAIDMWCF